MQMPYSRATINIRASPLRIGAARWMIPPPAPWPTHRTTKRAHMTEPVSGADAATFEMDRKALAARRNAKWCQYDPDVLPAFVAEMDFAVAAPIQAAIERIVREGDYGYPRRDGQRAEWAVACAFAAHMKSRFDWDT